MPAKKSVCVRCGQPTCRAHLLPQGFTRRVRGSDKSFEQLFRHKVGRKRSQSSLYDNEILCAAHDRELGLLDEYALAVCDKYSTKEHPILTHFYVPDVDADKLVRFVASIIWRCSISKRPETRSVDLGMETDAFAEIVFDKKISSIMYPQVGLMRCKSQHFSDVQLICGLPAPTTADIAPDLKFYTFLLGGFRWIAKIDRSPWPKHLPPVPINGQSYLTGTPFDLDTSVEFREMVNWALRNHRHDSQKKKRRAS